MKRDFKGIWIPKEIWLDNSLSLQEKVFLVEIESLDNNDGCYANNTYFSKFFGLSKTRVSEIINGLKEKGYIISNIGENGGNKRVLRVLKKTEEVLKKTEEGLKEKFKHNNTYNNTINKIELENLINKRNSVVLKNKYKIGGFKQLPKIRKINERLNKIYSLKRKEYSIEEISFALNNYINEIEKRKFSDTNTYYNHRFDLYKFLKQENGLDRFINF